MNIQAPSLTRLKDRCSQYARLMRIPNPTGHWLLLWPTLWGLWCASAGRPNPQIFIILVLGTMVMRTAGCVINDLTDRSFDGHVQRTKDRPLATGTLTTQEAYGLVACLLLMALGLAGLLNAAIWPWAISGLILATLYPWMKRITYFPQLVLGLTFSWGILIAFIAQCGTVLWYAWWLVAANTCWVMVYDTQYAMVDRRDDLQIGLRSTAILFANYDRLIIAILQALTTGLLASFGWHFHLGFYFYVALTLGTGIFIFQHGLICDREPMLCLKAFKSNQWYGLIIAMGFLASDFQYLAALFN